MLMEQNMVGWFEIPVRDMDRAMKFYNTVFRIEIQLQDFGGLKMGWFPSSETAPGASGSLILHPEYYTPSNKDGVLLYFSCKDLNDELGRVAGSGGQVIKEKTLISADIGYMGMFIDSEGNRIALHSRK